MTILQVLSSYSVQASSFATFQLCSLRSLCFLLTVFRRAFNSTQLNKPPRKVAHKRKQAHKSLIISHDSLDNSQVAF